MSMPMLRFLFRKMWNTRWLTLSTLLGLVMAVAFTTSIPMYSDGSLKRVVAKSLLEKSSGLPAGSLLIRYQAVGSDRAGMDELNDVNLYIQDQIPQDIGFPTDAYVRSLTVKGAQLSPADPQKVDPSKRRQMSLTSLSGLESHVEWSMGQMASEKADNGIIEAVVLDEAMYRNDLHVGDVFNYSISGAAGSQLLKVKIVGSFKLKNDSDPYWFQGLEGLVSSLIVHDDLFMKTLLTEKKIPLQLANWYYAFDLKNIQTSQLSPLGNRLERLDINLFQKLKNTKVDVSFQPILSEFKAQSLQMQTLLFTLAAPMIAMVFYILR